MVRKAIDTLQYVQVNRYQIMRFNGENGPDIAAWCGGTYKEEAKASDPTDVAYWIEFSNSQGKHKAQIWDYVVRNEQGVFSVISQTLPSTFSREWN